MNPAKFKVTSTDQFGKEIVIAEGYVSRYSFRTEVSPVYVLGSLEPIMHMPRYMTFELTGMILMADKPQDEARPMTGTRETPEASPYDDSDFDQEKLREADKWSTYDDD
jgi:hypothetical protein